MSFILVDCDHITCKKREENKLITGFLIKVKKEAVNTLNSLELKERKKYFDSEDFKKQVICSSYIIFDKKRNIIYLSNKIKKVKDFLRFLLKEFKSGVFCVLFRIDKKESTLDSFIENNFVHPHLTQKLSSGDIIPLSICLTYDRESKLTPVDVKNSIIDIMSKKVQKTCSIQVSIGEKAKKYMKKTCKKGSNKEFSGELEIHKIHNSGNSDVIYEIGVIESSIQEGTDENVDVVASRYNFHSHPEEAYVRHSVHKAWPSGTDYIGFAKLSSDTLLHIVSTLEGMYILTLTPEWQGKAHKLSRKVLKMFSIDHKEAKHDSESPIHKTKDGNLNPEGYVQKINKKRYKGSQIFQIYFFRWNEHVLIEINFPPKEQACLISQDQVVFHEKIYAS